MLIKEIAEENRPRERLYTLGAHALSDAELLAIILKTGHKTENVIDMSNRLISKYTINKLSFDVLRIPRRIPSEVEGQTIYNTKITNRIFCFGHWNL